MVGKAKTQGLQRSSHVEESFMYMPSGAVRVGQKVAFLPLMNDAAPRVFAVAPELPCGLTLDELTGVIHGIPQEATAGPLLYFVTSCDPCSSLGVSTAMIEINIAGDTLDENATSVAVRKERVQNTCRAPLMPKQETYDCKLDAQKMQRDSLQELVAQMLFVSMQLRSGS